MTRSAHDDLADGLLHAGAGAGMAVIWLGLLPGFLPVLGLVGVLTLVAVLPLLLLGVVGAVLVAPPYAIWRLVRAHRRRTQDADAALGERIGAGARGPRAAGA